MYNHPHPQYPARMLEWLAVKEEGIEIPVKEKMKEFVFPWGWMM